ncbi:DEAD/DEAH box helicase [Thalassospira sp.]|uniref:DEAD/DEAH box helicase n=1 Tax=Thalassospira sp. TaxID=1912094 RepID=UPI003AA89060
MFDVQTADLLRSAPAVQGLNPKNLPALLTYHYANLAAYRLGGLSDFEDEAGEAWGLNRIADTYELVAVLGEDNKVVRASAFVSATAQQILARRERLERYYPNLVNVNRDRLDPSLSSALLFLISEQFADANEAADAIQTEKKEELYEASVISEHVVDLAKGRLNAILHRGRAWRDQRTELDGEARVVAALLEAIASGIEIFAADFLMIELPDQIRGRFSNSNEAFSTVIELSSTKLPVEAEIFAESEQFTVDYVYAGPHQLAKLLLVATRQMEHASLMKVRPPEGADADKWTSWLRYRSERFPYVWPNHLNAIEQGFYNTGVSSVVVLPTGAGKTTISSLKIAGALASGKKVVFLAPTHALVEQLTVDLQEMFPREILDSVVSSDFDFLLQDGTALQDIEVMTPERCLAMLSFAQEAFKDVGLLVFDECHLLKPEANNIRRALDGMLCVLGFNSLVPEADFLFLSAMLKNASEVAGWLEELTGRTGISVDLVWKPSRQARGVIAYDFAEVEAAKKHALEVQKQEDIRLGKVAKSLRSAAKNELLADPYVIWGLQHNWHIKNTVYCSTTKLLDEKVLLAGELASANFIRATPNANKVASTVAASAARNNLKTIVFVNTKNDAVKVARQISQEFDEELKTTDEEALCWEQLEIELGDLKHSLLDGPTTAVPHNSAMIRLERDIAERMFKRTDGAQVIVATPTLAQGLNLPAQLAILAGDKRADLKGGRENLKAHEILNAAARAGRAGHLANGLVLLIPEPIIGFFDQKKIETPTIKKLQAVLPVDDHCVEITDPMQTVLDQIMQGQKLDRNAKYTINRFAYLPDGENAKKSDQLFDLNKSFAGYIARIRSEEAIFQQKVDTFRDAVKAVHVDETDYATAVLVSKSGLSADVLLELKRRVIANTGELPVDIVGWIAWMTQWLAESESARDALLDDIAPSIRICSGAKKDTKLSGNLLHHIFLGIVSWVMGAPLCVIEDALGGEPNSSSPTKQSCPRARALVSDVIPRGYSYVMGLIAHVVKEVDPYSAQENLEAEVVEVMSSAVRLGYDTLEKLRFSSQNRYMCRVLVHRHFDVA